MQLEYVYVTLGPKKICALFYNSNNGQKLFASLIVYIKNSANIFYYHILLPHKQSYFSVLLTHHKGSFRLKIRDVTKKELQCYDFTSALSSLLKTTTDICGTCRKTV